MTKRTRTIRPKQPRSAAYFEREIRLLRQRVLALDQGLKQDSGATAFAVFENAFAEQVEQDADADNVVRLRRRVR
jgi:hypothetical protein